MATYVVGDVQGCLDPLKRLLENVNFDPETDVLWSVGDIVNRGPQNLETLRFFYELRDSLELVLGNHDLHLLALAAGVRKPSRSDTLDDILQADDREIMLTWLQQQPLIHRQHGYTLVHAGIPPQWTAEQAAGYAKEVESALRGPKKDIFLREMYGNEPAIWSDDLEGMTRLRVITNYLTRMRHCTADGTLDLQSKGPVPDSPTIENQEVAPWFRHTERKAANFQILFGHWASINGATDTVNAIALDTGYVWGESMTLYHLETRQRTQVLHSEVSGP